MSVLSGSVSLFGGVNIASLKKDFEKIDLDGNGEIDMDELRQMLISRGEDPATAQKHVEGFARLCDTDHSGTISFEEFVGEYMRMQNFRSLRWLQTKFASRDGGPIRITRQDLYSVLSRQVGPEMASQQVEDCFRAVDTNRDGYLTVESLSQWYSTSANELKKFRKYARQRAKQKSLTSPSNQNNRSTSPSNQQINRPSTSNGRRQSNSQRTNTDSRHDHPLEYRATIDAGVFFCVPCGGMKDGVGYRCDACDYNMCEYCMEHPDEASPLAALPEGVRLRGGTSGPQQSSPSQTIQDARHEHPLTFQVRIDAGTFWCSGCNSMQTTEGFQCMECREFNLCKECADNPREREVDPLEARGVKWRGGRGPQQNQQAKTPTSRGFDLSAQSDPQPRPISRGFDMSSMQSQQPKVVSRGFDINAAPPQPKVLSRSFDPFAPQSPMNDSDDQREPESPFGGGGSGKQHAHHHHNNHHNRNDSSEGLYPRQGQSESKQPESKQRPHVPQFGADHHTRKPVNVSIPPPSQPLSRGFSQQNRPAGATNPYSHSAPSPYGAPTNPYGRYNTS